MFRAIFLNFIYLFIYCCVGSSFLCEGFSLVAASGGHSSSRCAGLPLSRPLLLRSTGSRRAGSAVVAHGPSRFAARGIFPDQGSNPRVPCIGRQTLNHCATREALSVSFLMQQFHKYISYQEIIFTVKSFNRHIVFC